MLFTVPALLAVVGLFYVVSQVNKFKALQGQKKINPVTITLRKKNGIYIML